MSRTGHQPAADSSIVAALRGPRGYEDAAALSACVGSALEKLGLPPDFVRPGDRVVLKPNWIRDADERYPGQDNRWQHVITHTRVLEAVIGWVAPRLQGRGSITLCDAPQTDSSFTRIRQRAGVDAMVEACRKQFPGIEIAVCDLRPEEWESRDGVTVAKRALPGDPLGSTVVALNENSEFVGFKGLGKLYGASYDTAETNRRHEGSHHEYKLCRTPMDADVLINVPKLKTHKKVGLTCALKNLVGINADKNWLPHHTEGTPDMGGDQFPAATTKARLEHTWMGAAKRWVNRNPALAWLLIPAKKVARLFFGDTQKVVRSGNWHGNDTCWRMVIDLNKCLLNYGGDGRPRAQPLRYLAVVDGIVGGEGNGPMAPDPVDAGVILAGANPLTVDCVAATVMGFDWRRIPLLADAFQSDKLPIASGNADEIPVVSDDPAWNGSLGTMKNTCRFRPHFGWTGHIERRDA